MTMIPCYYPVQPNEENVAICGSFASLKKLSHSDCSFSDYTIFCHQKCRNKNVQDGMNKTDENQDFQKGNTCTKRADVVAKCIC